MFIVHNPPIRELSSPMGRRIRVKRVREVKLNKNPQIVPRGGGEERKNSIFLASFSRKII